MQINFTKYQGAGNDFVLIDNRNKLFPAEYKFIEQLCDRRFGIGADGLMLLEKEKNYDFRMRYFNSDGKEASMCGNGGRCIVAFAQQLGIIRDTTKFIAVDGEHIAEIKKNAIKLKMQDVSDIEKGDNYFFMDTGSPHYVKFIDSHENFDTYKEGYAIRYNERFKKEGTNVNFVSYISENLINVSTYERGVEDETYACGTGCVASALSTAIKDNKTTGFYNIKTKGGDIIVYFSKDEIGFKDIYLEGPAKKVFEGNIEI
jgi:diaminopimelate epimerase